MKALSLISATLLGVLAPLSAFAQARPWLSDRASGEGAGYRTGDLELHPGLAGEIGYDSNYYQRSGDSSSGVDAPVEDALRFRITPHLTLSTLSPQRRVGDGAGAAAPSVTFRAGLFASYNELVGLGGNSDISKQRNLEGGLSALVNILPQNPISGDVTGSYSRSAQPSNDASLSSAWNRDAIGLGGGVSWRPGGGLFDWRLGYSLLYNYFEKDAYRDLNNITHTVGSRGRWKFLPRTAALFEAQSSWLRYGSGNAPRNDAQSVVARWGLNGLVTNHFAVLALAGWGATFYDPTATAVLSNYDSVVGQAELKWYIQPQPKLQPGAASIGLSSVSVGYLRDFANSYLADYYQRDRVYGDVSYFAGGRFLVDLQAGYSRINHPAFVSNGTPRGGLAEDRIDAQLFSEYRLSDSFGVNATLRYDASLTDVWLTTPATDTTEAVRDNLAFSRVTSWLGVRWFL